MSLKKSYFPTEREKSVLGAPTILVSLSSPESQCRFATTPQVFILSLHFHHCEAKVSSSAHSKHLETGAKENACYNCFSKRFSYVTYMRILSTHKCSYNYKLLSHFSVFTPESARTLQRQIAPPWLILSRVLCCRGTISNTDYLLSEQVLLEGWWSVNSLTGEKTEVTHARVWKIW